MLLNVGLSEALLRKNSELLYIEPFFIYLTKRGQFVSLSQCNCLMLHSSWVVFSYLLLFFIQSLGMKKFPVGMAFKKYIYIYFFKVLVFSLGSINLVCLDCCPVRNVLLNVLVQSLIEYFSSLMLIFLCTLIFKDTRYITTFSNY